MQIAVFGTGGVGGYFGGRLAEAGEDVTFIARGEHLQAIQKNGLRVDSIKGNFVIDPATATDDPAEVGPVDVVLVGVKARHVPQAAQAIQPMIGPDTFVVPLQNGVDAPGQLAKVVGNDRVLGGLCGIFSYIAGPGHICHGGIDPFVKFGEMDNRRSDRAERLRAVFERAGVDAEVPPDIQVATWEKFLLIVSWSGLGSITRAPIGVIRTVSQTRALLIQVMQEVYAVGRARNVALPETIVGDTLAYVDGLPPHGTASMQRDVMAGNPSELDTQNGAVVRLGRQAGIDTPANAFIYHSLLPLELQARGELTFPE